MDPGQEQGRIMNKLNVKYALGAALLAAVGYARAESTLLSGFETPGAWNTLGSAWYCFTDKTDSGASVITTADSMSFWDSTAYAPGASGSQGSLKVGFRFGDKKPVCGLACTYAPQVGIGTNMNGELDITGATAISFWAKADAPLKVGLSVGTTEVTDNGNFGRLVSITGSWAMYSVKLSDLTQPSWAKKVAFNAAHLKSIGFGISKGDNGTMTTGAYFLDDVAIEGWVPPVDPTAISARGSRSPGTGTFVFGERIRAGIPSGYAGKAGSVAALDSKGTVLGQTSFTAGERHVEMALPGSSNHTRVFLSFHGN